MKTALRIIAGFCAALFWLSSKDVTKDETAPAVVGLITYSVAMFIIFFVFFKWQRTMTQPPHDSEKHRVKLACCWFLVGSMALLGIFGLLFIGYSSEELAQTQTFSSIVESSFGGLLGGGLMLVVSVVALVSATGLLSGANWAKTSVTILSFLSAASFVGLLVALYTWWSVRAGHIKTTLWGEV